MPDSYFQIDAYPTLAHDNGMLMLNSPLFFLNIQYQGKSSRIYNKRVSISTSEECIEIINFLVECGRKPDSFSVSFPYIHHFREKGGDSSLEGYIDYCKSHTLTGQTNINVVKRLKHIKNQVKAFLDKNPDANGISSIKYQAFSKVAANAIPF